MRKPLLKQLLVFAAGVATVVSLACTEQLDAGKSCPLLCPEQAITLKDTVIDAIIDDTTLVGLPPIGSELYSMLASHGDTLDARFIVRFDTLPATFTKGGLDSTITTIDSAFVVAPRFPGDSLKRPAGPITVEAYDVDTIEADTSSAILASLFRPDRFLGSRTFRPESLTDTLRIPISTDTVLNRVTTGHRLRVGLKLVTAQGFDMRIGTTIAGTPATLRIIASLDTSSRPVNVNPISNSPPNQLFLSAPLDDYTIVVNGTAATPNTLLGVAGVPSRRVFLRFNVPSHIIDSTTIVRATLQLTQAPNRRVDAKDSAFVFPVAILAQPTVTDIASQLQFLSAHGFLGLDSLNLAPGDSGLREFQIVGLVRTWHGQTLQASPRTLGLQSGGEGGLPGEVDFFSTLAPPAVRPRLRLTYVPQSNFGIP